MEQKPNYQIEDLENEAFKKSNVAKRAVAGIGLVAAGAGAAFAATGLQDGETPESPVTADDLIDTVTNGVTEDSMPEPAEPEPAKPEEVHVYHHVVEEKPAEPDVKFDQSMTFVDEEGNIIAGVDEGTINGNKFATYDLDGDGKADYLAYDANGNNVFETNEIVNVEGENIHMQNPADRLFVQVETGSSDDYNWEVVEEDPLAYIHNDFTDEKTGEVYGDDLAENNPDYINNDDVLQYAGMEEYDNELAAEEPIDEIGDDLAYDNPVDDDMSQYDLV